MEPCKGGGWNTKNYLQCIANTLQLKIFTYSRVECGLKYLSRYETAGNGNKMEGIEICHTGTTMNQIGLFR